MWERECLGMRKGLGMCERLGAAPVKRARLQTWRAGRYLEAARLGSAAAPAAR